MSYDSVRGARGQISPLCHARQLVNVVVAVVRSDTRAVVGLRCAVTRIIYGVRSSVDGTSGQLVQDAGQAGRSS